MNPQQFVRKLESDLGESSSVHNFNRRTGKLLGCGPMMIQFRDN